METLLHQNHLKEKNNKKVEAKATFDVLHILVGLRSAIDIGIASPFIIYKANATQFYSNNSNNFNAETSTVSSKDVIIVWMVTEYVYCLMSILILCCRHYPWKTTCKKMKCTQTQTVYSAGARYVLAIRCFTTFSSFAAALMLTYCICYENYSTLATCAATIIALTTFLVNSLHEKFKA